MGAGKTTLGRHLARKLQLDFYDLDWYVEHRYRMKIPKIFEERGESGFREIERNMLHEVAEFEDIVLSCGGGTPCFFDNMDYMNSQAETFYLKAEPAVLKAHLLMGKSVRPLIQGKTPDQLLDFINTSLAQREAYYNQARHIININVIHTEEQIDEYVRQIITSIKTQRHNEKMAH